MPIHLARVSCPVGAQSLNDCHLGDGWRSAAGCSHALDVGIVCGPPDEVIKPPGMREFHSNTKRNLFKFLILF